MQDKKPMDTITLFREVLGDRMDGLILPPPSFTVMASAIIEYDAVAQSLITKIPVLEQWLNPYGTMQGGMIDAAIDNALGPLSLLIAPANMTRTMETKFLKAITLELDYIYVKAVLVEAKKRRLTFDVTVLDVSYVVYAHSRVVNFII